ncbi:alanine racemase [Paenibacillus daejeonensis]|uniref:alanine racemase n=1 Tax=Paenibacillus daejeonensis TaxID=135193 RepID=UPI00037DA04D|nr:alanine racemase [Paenibacillus daejeonensis]
MSRSGTWTWAEVHLDALARNVRLLRGRLPAAIRFMAAVKADGYGHGLVEAARTAVEAGADELAVSQLEEGVRLREVGIGVPILALTPPHPEEADRAARYRIAVPVFQASWLREMRAARRTSEPLALHIKMDTGMGRIGLRSREELAAMAPWLRSADLVVAGVYTHLATANQADQAYYRQQLQRFAHMRSWLAAEGWADVPAHCGNSAAAIQYPEEAADGMAMIRVGAALYGIDTCDPAVREQVGLQLEPTLSLYSTIVHVKRVRAGEYVGYDCTYRAEQDEWVGTVPLGYADGYSRSYAGFYLLVGGRRAPILGRVCMDQVMIRLPHGVPVGTIVTAIGRSDGAEITLDELAAHSGTIPQHVLTMLGSRVPRMMQVSSLSNDIRALS